MSVEIQVLSFEGCPNHEPARGVVEQVAAEFGDAVEVAHVDVPDAAAAVRKRFLGSPTIRVNGRDIEPGAEERTDFGLACRVFATSAGPSGVPDPSWLRDAIEAALVS